MVKQLYDMEGCIDGNCSLVNIMPYARDVECGLDLARLDISQWPRPLFEVRVSQCVTAIVSHGYTYNKIGAATIQHHTHGFGNAMFSTELNLALSPPNPPPTVLSNPNQV